MLSFIFIGWPKRTKQIGPAYPAVCPSCGQDTALYLLKARRWLKIYFLPLLPLAKAEYFLTCGNCGYTLQPDSKSEINRAKRAVKLTRPWMKHAKDDREYWEEMNPLLDESDIINHDTKIGKNEIDEEPAPGQDANRGIQ